MLFFARGGDLELGLEMVGPVVAALQAPEQAGRPVAALARARVVGTEPAQRGRHIPSRNRAWRGLALRPGGNQCHQDESRQNHSHRNLSHPVMREAKKVWLTPSQTGSPAVLFLNTRNGYHYRHLDEVPRNGPRGRFGPGRG